MKTFLYLLSTLSLIACGHHKDVRAGVEGTHRVMVKANDEESAERAALSQANHFCEDRYEKVAAIVSEKTKYIGDMDEGDYKAYKRTSDVLTHGGGSAWVFGGKNEKNLGKTASGAGSVLGTAIGKGYRTLITFKCV